MRGQDGIAKLSSLGGSKLNLATIDGTSPVLVARWRDPNTGWHASMSGWTDETGSHGMSSQAYREGYLIVGSRIPVAGLHKITQCYHLAQAGPYTYPSFFTSTDPNCEGQTYAAGGTYYLADGPIGDMQTPLFRCYNPSNGDHLDTTNPAAECNANTGFQTEFVLGFGS